MSVGEESGSLRFARRLTIAEVGPLDSRKLRPTDNPPLQRVGCGTKKIGQSKATTVITGSAPICELFSVWSNRAILGRFRKKV